MCNYLSRFTPNLSEIVKPLTELTHVDAVWSWSFQDDKAFSSATSAIANATTLKLFDVNKPCVLQVDASDSDLGGALLQDGDDEMRFLTAHGSSFRKTYSSRVGDDMRLQMTITVIGLR